MAVVRGSWVHDVGKRSAHRLLHIHVASGHPRRPRPGRADEKHAAGDATAEASDKPRVTRPLPFADYFSRFSIQIVVLSKVANKSHPT